MHEMDYTVTLTAKDLAFRERAREAGIPAIVVSMYAGALQKLVEDEREECAKLCDDQKRFDARWNMACLRLSKYIRARGEK